VAGFPLVVAGQNPNDPATLTPVAKRITDEAVYADHQRYAAVQTRIKSLNDAGRRVADYHLAKAQCWLDVSFHEYTRNDRSSFPQDAMSESVKLVRSMETKLTSEQIGFDTPLVNSAARLRPDLWARLTALKKNEGFVCVQNKVACAEVELVHAGNEYNQQQWRHANPYIQIAEDLTVEAETASSACIPNKAPQTVSMEPRAPAPAKPVAAATPSPLPAPIVLAKPLSLSARLVFNFDKRDAANIRESSMVALNELIGKTKVQGTRIEKLVVTGHADQLNATGNTRYNIELAKDRAETVRQILLSSGIKTELIEVEARADAQPIASCPQKFKRPGDLQECLLPNRRVEVVITGTQKP
jgi:outer membrane protein OmpA-like peptidoglycan-associated protein